MRIPSPKLLFLPVSLAAAIVPAATAVGALLGAAGTLTVSPPAGTSSAHRPGSTVPHCVVFQSTSTLTSPDTSGKWSIYLFDINTKKITLLSPAGVDARDGVVDGHCGSVTYESGGKVYVVSTKGGTATLVANGFNPDQETDGKGVAYDRAGQVYYTDWVQNSVKF